MSVNKESIVVERLAKYGPVVNGQFYSLSSKSGLSLSAFEVGKQYEVLVYTSDSGKKYINQVVGGASTKKDDKPGDIKSMVVPSSTYAITNKDDRILWQGITQAVLQDPSYQMFSANRDELIANRLKDIEMYVNFIKDNAK